MVYQHHPVAVLVIKIWFNYDVNLNDFVETPISGDLADTRVPDRALVSGVNWA